MFPCFLGGSDSRLVRSSRKNRITWGWVPWEEPIAVVDGAFTPKTVEKPVLDDEGRETKSKTKVKVGGGYSPYARIWGRDTSNEWDPQPAYNIAKLRSVQEYCTLRLNARGHLFLNEVYDMLGLERTKPGAVVGWVWDNGDNYVDFGVFSDKSDRIRDFVNGREASILLDFNVDGVIYDKI